MKTKILLPVAAVVVVAVMIWGYFRMSKERTAEAEGEEPVAAASAVQHGTNGEAVISLDNQAQQLIGLETTILKPATQSPEIKAYGRVLDPAPLVSTVSDIESAQAAADASSKEYERLKSLAQTQNASAKALEAADVAVKRDRIALQAAQARLIATWGEAIADEQDLPAFVQSLVQLETVLVRLDLPAGESLKGTPTDARVVVPGEKQPTAARFLGVATTTDSLSQGQGFLFLVANTVSRLTPGLAITGFLQLPGQSLHGAVVPDAAIVRSAERAWVYAQNGDTTFARREVTLNHPVSGGWFVTNGVSAGDRLVVKGAQTLLSEERKTQIRLED